MGPGVERKPPPLVREVRRAALAIAGAVSLWAGLTYRQQARMLDAVQAMKPDTVKILRTDTVYSCTRDDDDTARSPF